MSDDRRFHLFSRKEGVVSAARRPAGQRVRKPLLRGALSRRPPLKGSQGVTERKRFIHAEDTGNPGGAARREARRTKTPHQHF